MSDLTAMSPQAFEKWQLDRLNEAEAAGIKDQFIQWLKVWGPQIAALLLKLFIARHNTVMTRPEAFHALAPTAFGENWLKSLFINIIVDYRPALEKWINEGESVIYDAIVALVSSKSSFLADILKRYKDTVIGLDDQLTTELLDKLIENLKSVK
jgi:hypothetical protein